MAKATIRKRAVIRTLYVNKIVKDLLTEERPFILTQLREAILNTEQFSLKEWEDLYNGLARITTLKPQVDLIVKLRAGTDHPAEQASRAAN